VEWKRQRGNVISSPECETLLSAVTALAVILIPGGKNLCLAQRCGTLVAPRLPLSAEEDFRWGTSERDQLPCVGLPTTAASGSSIQSPATASDQHKLCSRGGLGLEEWPRPCFLVSGGGLGLAHIVPNVKARDLRD
jgi:hypothetical protein